MTAYEKDALIPPGTRVKVIDGAPYGGQLGTVVQVPPLKSAWSMSLPDTRMTYVQIDGKRHPYGYFTFNLERIETVTNLVGPKPEPVKEPTHPTPWKAQGKVILDANGVQVLKVQMRSEYNNIPLYVAVELADVITKAVNKYFEKDTPSPF
jgi:hypothetical protein